MRPGPRTASSGNAWACGKLTARGLKKVSRAWNLMKRACNLKRLRNKVLRRNAAIYMKETLSTVNNIEFLIKY
jgi:hypothetical protein